MKLILDPKLGYITYAYAGPNLSPTNITFGPIIHIFNISSPQTSLLRQNYSFCASSCDTGWYISYRTNISYYIITNYN
uniref:Uncharacterized protein n=1 Tax=Cannabis sativa TaxID=3483 RepID=A0A803RC35_CANSA